MTELGRWTFGIFQKHQYYFNKETASLSQAVLLCYICCASEVARIKGGAKWFTRSIDEMSADLGLTASDICRGHGVLRGAMLIERKCGKVGANQRLLFRAVNGVVKGFEFIENEIKDEPMTNVFVKELVPVEALLAEIRDCFGIC